MKTPLSILLTCALTFPQLGCKPNTVDRLVVSLSAVSAASAIAIAVATSLEANEAIATETAAQIISYSQSVSQATSKAIAELSFAEPDRQKILNIAAIFASIPRVVLADADPKAAAVIQAIQVAIETLMAQLEAAARLASTGARTANAALTSERAAELVEIDAQARQAASEASRWTQEHRLVLAAYMK